MASFSCINLECGDYNKTTTIPEYHVAIRSGVTIFLDNYKKQIICPTCGKPLVRLKEEFGGFCTNVATFNSKSPQEKREILKKRANDAYRRNVDGMKEYRDYQDEVNK